MTLVSSWGRLDKQEHDVCYLSSSDQAVPEITSAVSGIAYGMGRSYGDVCLNPEGRLWNTSKLNRFLAFDQHSGLLSCQAGVTLQQIQQLFIPRGWALPVTPGTQYVTVGGALANDVHGKNHHVHGSFGDHVTSIKLLRSDATMIECGQGNNEQWFNATVGGIGLTGLILEVELQLRPVNSPWINAEIIPFEGLDDFLQLSRASESDCEYNVSWVDAASSRRPRGIFISGNHAMEGPPWKQKQGGLTMPFQPPLSMVNHLSVKLFNAAYYQINKYKAGRSKVHYRPFFYPLDNIGHWNRMYGPNGFYQHQCVIPFRDALPAMESMLARIHQSGQGSFLSVLKTFGERQSRGLLGFPRPGITLAMDFPNKGERTLSLLAELDNIVVEAGGSIYLAKDARMSKGVFRKSYPMIEEFMQFRDPGISSAMSRRLMEV